MRSVSFFQVIHRYFMFGIKIFNFWGKRINSGPIFYMSESFFGLNHYKKPVFMFMRHYKEIFPWEFAKKIIFWPYGYDYLGFLTNAQRGAMRSKSWWDLDWWPGPQKVQFGEITGYPEVVGLILALLRNQNPPFEYFSWYVFISLKMKKNS